MGLKELGKLIRENKEGIDVARIFSRDYDEAVLSLYGVSRPSSKKYKPSSINCIRACYYKLTDAEGKNNPKQPYVCEICEAGSDAHIRMQTVIQHMKGWEFIDVAQYIKDNNLDYLKVTGKTDTETKVLDTRYNISFFSDGIVRHIKSNRYFIFEGKTEKQEYWIKRKGVDEAHVAQSYCYSLSTKIEDVIFMYENRNDCKKKVFELNITPENRSSIITLITTCDSCINDSVVPVKPNNVPYKICLFCDYKELCEKHGK